jgi:hypothetical protein
MKDDRLFKVTRDLVPIGIISTCLLLVSCAGSKPAEESTFADTDGRIWKQVLQCDFSSSEGLQNWKLEGAAEVSTTVAGELLIENTVKRIDEQDVSRSTLWYREPIWGDLKFVLEVKGEDRGGNIFFFNAQPLEGHKSIFEWNRPKANYVDYTADSRMHMYTLGMLRAHQDEINLRFLGGELAYLADPSKADARRSSDPDNQFDAATRAEFARKTILHSAASPFEVPERYYRIELTIVGNRICVLVDDEEVIDFTDSARPDPSTRGGYFAFRNFATTRAWCRLLRVFRLEQP